MVLGRRWWISTREPGEGKGQCLGMGKLGEDLTEQLFLCVGCTHPPSSGFPWVNFGGFEPGFVIGTLGEDIYVSPRKEFEQQMYSL